MEVERALRRVGQEVGEEEKEEGDLTELEAGEVQVSRAMLEDGAAGVDDSGLLACSAEDLDGVGKSSVDVVIVGRLVRMVATGDIVLVRVISIHGELICTLR